jgi:hypothetical protein
MMMLPWMFTVYMHLHNTTVPRWEADVVVKERGEQGDGEGREVTLGLEGVLDVLSRSAFKLEELREREVSNGGTWRALANQIRYQSHLAHRRTASRTVQHGGRWEFCNAHDRCGLSASIVMPRIAWLQ